MFYFEIRKQVFELLDADEGGSIKAALTASYRRATGESPTGNFSRIIDGYRMSSYSRKSQRGGSLPTGESEPYADPGIAPLNWDSYKDPTAPDWMGL